MDGPADRPNFFAGINKAIRFFRYTKGSGLLFCACADRRLVREANRTIREKAGQAGLDVRETYIPSEKAGEIMHILREAAQDRPDGLIVNNLDELVLSGGKEFVHGVNLARERITDLDISLLFWLTPENISVFANAAPDLFSRRDRGVVEFAGTLTGETALRRFNEELAPVYAETADFRSMNRRIELLESQHKEAVARGYPEKRVALEIAADLINAYLKVHLRREALELFERYRGYYEKRSDLKLIRLTASVFDETGAWDKALEYYRKAEQINSDAGDRAGLGTTYNNIGAIYSQKGEWDKALEFYHKAEQILVEVGNRDVLGTTYNNIGTIYYNKGEWDKALEFYRKSEQILIEVGNRDVLGTTYNNIGTIYSNKGEWDKALGFHHKSEQIRIEVGDRAGLGTTYNNIGTIYSNKGEWDKALEFYLKDEQIDLEVGDRAGLGTTYSNIGAIYSNKGEWDKALEFYHKAEQIGLEVGDRAGLAYSWFNIGTTMQEQSNADGDAHVCAAAYMSESLGMRHECSVGFSWAIDPLEKKLGKEKVMEIGRKFCEERLAGNAHPHPKKEAS